MPKIAYDPFSPEIIHDPHPIYRRLRDEDPCHYIERWDTWALSRFEDIWNASTDAGNYTAAKGTTAAHLMTKVQPVTPMIAMMDPPTHTELRAKISPFFTPGAVRKLEAQIQSFVDDAWAGLGDAPEADLYNDFAAQVSVKVACLANGFPMADSDMLNALVWQFFSREEGRDGMTEAGLQALGEMTRYFAELIAKRRAAGRNDGSVVDVVVGAEIGGRNFTDEEAGSHLSMFLIGGAETFPKVFSSAVLRLWENADQRAQVAADPGLTAAAFHEVLRYDMPTQFLMRVCKNDVPMHGKTMRAGQPVMFIYPSANRDDREFENPDAFDIHRRPPRILTFGHGTHACIGQHFAKIEGRLCLRKLLDAAPNYEVKRGELRRIRTEFVQGWETMPVVLQP